MKTLLVSLALLSMIPAAHATEYARVLDATEIVRQVPVSRQVCRTEEISGPGERSAGGAIIGGIAGGVLGHGVGRGSGKTAATAIGAITGAIVGDRIGNRDVGPSTRQVQRCHNEQAYEDQIAGYRVTYEYAGKRYTTRMAQDPGDRVALRISVVGGEDDAPLASRDDRYDDEQNYRHSDYRRQRF